MANSLSSESYSISVMGTDGRWHTILDGDEVHWNVDAGSGAGEPILENETTGMKIAGEDVKAIISESDGTKIRRLVRKILRREFMRGWAHDLYQKKFSVN